MYDLKDKVVLVTGASKGIGAQFVREILEEGVEVMEKIIIYNFAG